VAESPGSRSEPTLVLDDVHITYRVHGSGGLLSRLRGRPAVLPPDHVHAVRGVTFVVRRGEAVGVIGANGSGKSSLLRAIAGLLPPAAGRIWTAGRPSLLGVDTALMGDLSGARNVWLGGLAMGLSPAEIRARHRGIIEFSGIDERARFSALPMRTYSSGMSSRLRFAIAASRQHDVLLLDEALNTGDHAFRTRSRARIQELREQAGTVLLVSHSHHAIRESCDRVLWLDGGRLRMDGPTEQVLATYEEAAQCSP